MTTIPKGATVPADHNKPAAQIEAEGIETTDVEWNGLTLTVPSDSDDWPVESVLAFEEGKVVSGLRAGLGAVQWAAVMKTKPLKRDLSSLFDSLAETLGFERAGN